jgi:sirohydrochlorin ferrochelatase
MNEHASEPSPNEPITAVLLIAHGSRHAPANDDLFRMVAQISERGDYAIVEPAFLELAEPTIDQGGARCVERGAKRVLLVPYFLSAGVHLLRDLAAARDDLRERYPQIEFRLGTALGPHPLLEQLVLEKIRSVAANEHDQADDDARSFAERYAPLTDDH